jgi:hypothetical protein
MPDDPMENDPAPRPHGKPPKPRCGAHARSTGQSCKRGAGAGTSHPGTGLCSNHGGSSPGGTKQAERLAVEAAAERLGLPVATTAAAAMQDGLDRANGLVVWLVSQLGALDPADLTWGLTQRRIRPAAEPGGQPAVEVTQASRVHPLFAMWERGEARLTRIAVDMARLGIEQRRASVLEQDGATISALFDRLVTEYAQMWRWSAQERAEARAVVARLFHEQAAIEGGDTGG